MTTAPPHLPSPDGGHASEAETHRYSTVEDGERLAAAAEVVSILTERRK